MAKARKEKPRGKRTKSVNKSAKRLAANNAIINKILKELHENN